MVRRGPLPKGAGGVGCVLCGARAAASGTGAPIVLRHGANCQDGAAIIGTPIRHELFTFWPALNPSDLGVLLADERVWALLCDLLLRVDDVVAELPAELLPLRDALVAVLAGRTTGRSLIIPVEPKEKP